MKIKTFKNKLRVTFETKYEIAEYFLFTGWQGDCVRLALDKHFRCWRREEEDQDRKKEEMASKLTKNNNSTYFALDRKYGGLVKYLNKVFPEIYLIDEL